MKCSAIPRLGDLAKCLLERTGSIYFYRIWLLGFSNTPPRFVVQITNGAAVLDFLCECTAVDCKYRYPKSLGGVISGDQSISM